MRPLIGISYKLASSIAFALMIAAIKLVGDRIPAGETVFFRSFVAILPVSLMVLWQGEFTQSWYTTRPFDHIFRSAFGVCSMFMWFSAFQRLPIADALAISYAAPLVTVVLAALILGEVVRAYRWTAVVVGFSGVMVMLAPHLGGVAHLATDRAATGALMALSSALFAAFAAIQVRRLTQTEPTAAIVIYFSIGSSLFALLSAPFGWVWPDQHDLLCLIAAGLCGGLGQLFMTQSFRHADASTLAPLDYTSILWTTALGYMLFDEIPGSSIVFGAIIVIGSGVFIILREHALRRQGRILNAAPTRPDA